VSRKSITVISHAGYRESEYPKAFVLEGERIEITVILDRWVEEDVKSRERTRCFRVFGSDGHGYQLLYNERTGEWALK